MKLKMLFKSIAIMSLFIFSGCGGSGSDGLNGAIELTTDVQGANVTATATYTNPTKTNLIGVPITFSFQQSINGVTTTVDMGTFNTNNSGSIAVNFTPYPFIGTQDIVVQASSGNVTNYSVVTVTGATFKLTPPVDTELSAAGATTAPGGAPATFALNAPTFATITDPFSGDVLNHPIIVTATLTSSSGATITPTSQTIYTDTAGVASLSGFIVTIPYPDTTGSNVAVISWQATDQFTGLTATGSTTLKATRSADYVPPAPVVP